jgi:Protein of unknown function (DUF4058)
MQIHNWTRVGDATFHAFHTRWITHLSDALNKGRLPRNFYSDPEQHVGRRIADVLTLHASDPERLRNIPEPEDGVAVALAEAPPRVSSTLTLGPPEKRLRRTLTIRHTSGHRIVALVEILSPSNKATATDVEEFVAKAKAAIDAGIHLSVIDLFPPGKHDPAGMQGEIVRAVSEAKYKLPRGKPLTFVSFLSGSAPVAYQQHAAVGDKVPDLPLFLTTKRYVDLPLQATYATAWTGVPEFWREVIEGKRPAPDTD